MGSDLIFLDLTSLRVYKPENVRSDPKDPSAPGKRLVGEFQTKKVERRELTPRFVWARVKVKGERLRETEEKGEGRKVCTHFSLYP